VGKVLEDGDLKFKLLQCQALSAAVTQNVVIPAVAIILVHHDEAHAEILALVTPATVQGLLLVRWLGLGIDSAATRDVILDVVL